jgi:EAL domain-containing protein (putative c-di-GMP-specific phosphodiesterase class I)
MCDRANTALRTIREDLRKTVAYFDEGMLKKSLYEQEVISGFETALKEGQFRMYLQPVVGENGDALGAEALVRWVKPDGTVLMPDEFISIFENAGLIHRLDEYMWECAVRKLKAWTDTGMGDLFISVNMSAKDFYSLDFAQVLSELTDRYEVEPKRLRLEITETALLEDPVKGNAALAGLRSKGFVVEIDDFGKGYSSIGLLKDLQADVLKIDMSLLREIETRERSRTILNSIIEMAYALGMDVITEGVETEAQLKAVAALGCGHFQGYYFSRPVSVESFENRYGKKAA